MTTIANWHYLKPNLHQVNIFQKFKLQAPNESMHLPLLKNMQPDVFPNDVSILLI